MQPGSDRFATMTDAAVRRYAIQMHDALELIVRGCDHARPELKPELVAIREVAEKALRG